MAIPSKEEKIFELFVNEPTRQWHFSEIVKISQVSINITGKWLKKYRKEKIIKRVKPKGKMPYFISNIENPLFLARKRLYAMQKLFETGLISELYNLKNAKTIIIFGSFVQSEWTSDSDVDIFIYGKSDYFKFGRLWKGLGFQGKPRELQVHTFNSIKELKEVKSGLLKNVLRGYLVKGDIDEIIEAAVV